jgi:hypothetical protein
MKWWLLSHRSFFTGLGFVDFQCPTIQFLAVAIRHRFGGLGEQP